jgi:hypothetical protein
VYIASANGESAISITNSGVQIIGPNLTGSASSNNTFGGGGSNSGTASVNNSIGMGSTGTGSVTNYIGGAAGTGAVTNIMGSAGSVNGATVSNSIGSGGSSNDGSVTNSFGRGSTGSSTVNNTFGQSMAGGGAVTNQFGGGAGVSTNGFGSVTGSGSATNNIGVAASPNSATVNNIGTGQGVTTTAVGNTNARSTVSVAAGSSNLSMANGQASLIAGSTSGLTLDSRGATFGGSNGAAEMVHGVDDGVAATDAANVRQLDKAVAASMATVAGLPALGPGETAMGVGVGSYGGYESVGLAFAHMMQIGAMVTVAVANPNDGRNVAVRGGVGWKF